MCAAVRSIPFTSDSSQVRRVLLTSKHPAAIHVLRKDFRDSASVLRPIAGEPGGADLTDAITQGSRPPRLERVRPGPAWRFAQAVAERFSPGRRRAGCACGRGFLGAGTSFRSLSRSPRRGLQSSLSASSSRLSSACRPRRASPPSTGLGQQWFTRSLWMEGGILTAAILPLPVGSHRRAHHAVELANDLYDIHGSDDLPR
jgi:hypothetical protein